MPIKENREYRAAALMSPTEGEYTVRGYATTFGERYLLYSFDGTDYYEQVDAGAFDGADMTDVIMQYDHQGMVYARIKNGTLRLTADSHGLAVEADLSSTEESRKLYEAIKTGLVVQMSFAFTVSEDSYNSETHTRTILKIKKVYDVSAVSIPANPSTEISARSYIEGVIEREAAERLQADARDRQRRKIRILMEI